MNDHYNLTAFDSEATALPVESVEEEYEWVALHAAWNFSMDDAFPFRQALTVRDGAAYDTLFLTLPDGSIREYWFDISSFYKC